jgi:hypothetical protein
MPTYGYGYALTTRMGTVVAGALPPQLTAELEAQRAETIKWAMPYPPRMTAAMPATAARRNAAVMVYSMADPIRPTQEHPAPLSSITSTQVAPAGFRDILADRLNVCEVCLDWERNAGHERLFVG